MNSPLFYPITVSAKEVLLDGQASTISFEIPENLRSMFSWKAGQHVSIKLTINEMDYRRSYSISSPPDSKSLLQITVKRVKAGVVSNYINDQLEPGAVVELMPPFGKFCLEPNQEKRRTLYFYGAGSGITPLFSMIQSALANESNSSIHLLYGNRSQTEILFADSLAELADSQPERCSVKHVLSKPSFFHSMSPWMTGRISPEIISEHLRTHRPYAQDSQYFICGPGEFISSVKSALRDLDVPKTRIYFEYFAPRNEEKPEVRGTAANLKVLLDGKQHELSMRADQTLLQACKEKNINVPFSCESGICGACKATLEQGDVHMHTHSALELDEIKSGQILACQATARTETLVVKFT